MSVKSFITFLSVAVFLSIPTVAYGRTGTATGDTAAQIAHIQQLIAALQAQLGSSTKGTNQVQVQTTSSSEWQFVRPYVASVIAEDTEEDTTVLDNWNDLTVFTVKNGQLKNSSLQTKDIAKTDSYKIWELFKQIAGAEFTKQHIREYMTYDLPVESTQGFVEHFDNSDPLWSTQKYASSIAEKDVNYGITQKRNGVSFARHDRGWGLAVNVGDFDLNNRELAREFVITLLHEYAHILTQNEEQVDHDMTIVKVRCKSLGRYLVSVESSVGCAEKDSYLQAFVTRFWSTTYPKSQSNFVTEYASTLPEEDIAESFTNFVLEQKPIAAKDRSDEKILFFHAYPELVALRDEIRSNVEKYFVN